MEWNVVAMAVLGLAVCCLGFARRPRSSLELISSRFVIPLMIASAIFAQVFWHYWQDDTDLSIFGRSRVQGGFDAVVFVTLCLLCFWIGYASPVGRRAVGWLFPLALPLTPGKDVLHAAQALCFLALLIFTCDGLIPEVMILIPGLHAFTFVTIFIGAVLLGLSFPDKSSRNVLDYPLLLFWLFVLSLPLMASFSRGVGIPVITAAAAYSVRRGRINWLGIGLACIWSIFGAQIAFSGRGAVGHYAGALAWLNFAASGGFLSDFYSTFQAAMNANDSFTPLCVSISAVASGKDVFALPPMNWLYFQIPIPHIFSWSPTYPLELTQFVGGAGTWGYTPGIFGDVFVHLGWPGMLMFILVGCVYRGIDVLAFSESPPGTINPFFLLVVFGYVAMALGLFGMFRTWNTGLFDGTCFVLFILFIRKVIRPAESAAAYWC